MLRLKLYDNFNSLKNSIPYEIVEITFVLLIVILNGAFVTFFLKQYVQHLFPLFTDSLKIYIAVDVLLLVIMLVGLVTNVLSTVVWMTQSKGNSAALFIGCLSFIDALYCLAILIFSIINIITIAHEMDQSYCFYYMAWEVNFFFANASR